MHLERRTPSARSRSSFKTQLELNSLNRSCVISDTSLIGKGVPSCLVLDVFTRKLESSISAGS